MGLFLTQSRVTPPPCGKIPHCPLTAADPLSPASQTSPASLATSPKWSQTEQPNPWSSIRLSHYFPQNIIKLPSSLAPHKQSAMNSNLKLWNSTITFHTSTSLRLPLGKWSTMLPSEDLPWSPISPRTLSLYILCFSLSVSSVALLRCLIPNTGISKVHSLLFWVLSPSLIHFHKFSYYSNVEIQL